MAELWLTGLDGRNPLAFLAALGLLDALAEGTKAGQEEPKLVWHLAGSCRPAIVNGPSRDGLLNLLAKDIASFRGEPAIERLRYSKEGGAVEHDLKPPPGRFAKYLRDLAEARSRRSLAFAAAFATDVAVDRKGNTKPTALHFTTGQQEFLAMVTKLVECVRVEDLDEALFGPWRYERNLPVLRWDNTSTRDYALLASDPAEKKLGVPGADWLAFRGLPFFPVAPVGDRVATTGCRGSSKTGAFRWPIWSVPLTRSVLHSVLASPELFEVEPTVLAARGVSIVFESTIHRSEHGYGSFAPARVALPLRGIGATIK